MKKISVEVEELLNPKITLTQKIIMEVQKSKTPLTTSQIYEKLPDNSRRAIRAIITELLGRKILSEKSYCQCGRTRLLELG